jgi:tRNA1Val (adenine37-N6)-methyltransferase
MRDPNRLFKDWVMPGPDRPADVELLPLPEDPALGKVTLDALSGRFRIHQYERGHRFSTDDVLAAWYGTTKCPSPARVLDLGSGVGSVGMMAAWRLPGAQLVTLEAQEISVRLARRSAELNGLTPRYEILEGDLRDPALLARQAPFDLVLGSPPYFPLGTGELGEHPQTIPCRFEVRGNIADYAQAAARHLAPGGIFAFVFPAVQLERAHAGVAEAGLSTFCRRDVVFREGNAPLVSLLACALESDLPVSLRGKLFVEPPLVVRLINGDVSPEYRTVKLTMGFRP